MLLEATSNGATLPASLGMLINRTVFAVVNGSAAAGASASGIVKAAQTALWRLFFVKIQGGLVGGATALAITAGIVTLQSLTTASASSQPASTLVTGTNTVQTADQNPSGTASPPEAEPPLITAIKKEYTWQTAPQFKTALDSIKGNIDSMRDANGLTALHWAAKKKDEEFALLLLLRGASPNAEDSSGRTPFFYALENEDEWMTLLFVLANTDLNHVAAGGVTPITIAVSKGSVKYAELLLWLGAKPTVNGLPDAAQPLTLARASGNAELINLVENFDNLTSKSFAQQPREIPTFVKDALHDAARKADFVQLEDFLREGVNINLPDDHGATALHRAISAGQGEMVFYLLLLGANPNAKDNDGRTPLMNTMGWFGGGLDAMRRFLILKGANPHAIKEDGHTEMSWAAQHGNEAGVQWLLWLGVNGYEKNLKYGSPTQVAFRAGSQRVVDLLRRNGVNEPLELSDDPVWNLNNAALRGDMELLRKLGPSRTAIWRPPSI